MNVLRQSPPLDILFFAACVSGIGNWITTMALFALLIFRRAVGSNQVVACFWPRLARC